MKSKKDLIGKLLVTACMIFCAAGLMSVTGSASSSSSPIALSMNGTWVSASMTDSNEGVEWYKIRISSDGEVILQLQSCINDCHCYVYTEDMSTQLKTFSARGTSAAPDTVSEKLAFSKGTYLIKISSEYKGNYKLYAKFTSYSTNDGGADSYDFPKAYTIGSTITGALTLTDREDWYKFTVTSSGNYVMTLRNYSFGYWSDLYWEVKDRGLINKIEFGYLDNEKTDSANIFLKKGTYYLHIITGSGKEYGKYVFSMAPASCSHTYKTSTVVPTYFANGYTLHTCTKCGDSYKDNYTSKKSLAISSLVNKAGGIKLTWSSVYGATGYSVYRKIGSGAYQQIAKLSGVSTVSYKDNKVKNGKAYKYKVVPYNKTASGSGNAKKIVRVNSRNLNSVQNSSPGSITVKWKKNAKANGYQILWSTSSNFKNNKKSKKLKGSFRTSYTISGLTRGTMYYVKIRPYRKASGKNYYAAWSTVKNIRIIG